jgi:murein DD-endopeptidase MepM/ murein hydrolase activator NlpD
LAKADMPINATQSVSLQKTADGEFQTAMVKKPVITRTYARSARIETSLYGSALKAGIPAEVIAYLIKTYSYNVDFQRDIRHGDLIQVMYTQDETKDGDFVKAGNMLYARLVIDGRDVAIYRFEHDGGVSYYTADGKSIRNILMRTPIDGARISSRFGMRFHPVLGYTRMHKGIDFAAPIGTPIYAAGDGVVERCNHFSSYGNYIKIRHNRSTETAYAHISRFAKGMHKGEHVHQGEVIAYVGETGRATGPHLHYEVLIHGKQVNPATVSLAQADPLRGKTLSAFKAHVGKINQQFSVLNGGVQTASNTLSFKTLPQ